MVNMYNIIQQFSFMNRKHRSYLAQNEIDKIKMFMSKECVGYFAKHTIRR